MYNKDLEKMQSRRLEDKKKRIYDLNVLFKKILDNN